MCTYSMVGDWSRDTLPKRHPWISDITEPKTVPWDGPTRAEFDALKRDIEDIRDLLKRAAIYDKANGEPECEVEEKIAFLKKIAEFVGVNLEDAMPLDVNK